MDILKTIFQKEIEAIIKSKEYKKDYYRIDKNKREIIEKNLELIADVATNHYIEKYGDNPNDDVDFVNEALADSINSAILKFKEWIKSIQIWKSPINFNTKFQDMKTWEYSNIPTL